MAKDDLPRLLCRPLERPPRIVLVEPEIPPNTGNIARLAAGLACPLHLVGPLGFDIGEKAVRRAGLDYWPLVDLQVHASLDEFLERYPDTRLWLLSAVARKSLFDVCVQPGDAMVFGRESVGLPESLLANHPERALALPLVGGVRCLNLSNAVAVTMYEAYRQLGAFGQLL